MFSFSDKMLKKLLLQCLPPCRSVPEPEDKDLEPVKATPSTGRKRPNFYFIIHKTVTSPAVLTYQRKMISVKHLPWRKTWLLLVDSNVGEDMEFPRKENEIGNL